MLNSRGEISFLLQRQIREQRPKRSDDTGGHSIRYSREDDSKESDGDQRIDGRAARRVGSGIQGGATASLGDVR